MKYVYVNMDNKLIKKGGRKAARISKEDFMDKLHKLSDAYEGEETTSEEFGEENISYWAVTESSKVAKDIAKISFDNENSYCSRKDTPVIDESVPNLMGVNTLDNGLTFLGCMAGGDWETPVFFTVYWDGKSLRGYIPSYGNTVNLDFKTAFGSEGENGVDVESIVNKAKYKRILTKEEIAKIIEEEDMETLCDLYLKEQGVNDDDAMLVVNWGAVKEDIENRIEVK